MAKGSESATWKWAGLTRHCDTCGNELRIKDVALFYGSIDYGSIERRHDGTPQRETRTFPHVQPASLGVVVQDVSQRGQADSLDTVLLVQRGSEVSAGRRLAAVTGIGERFIRCFVCVEARVELAIEETRRVLAARPIARGVAA